jgi:uncharacterized lipoprotein YehR (DUF1307 family)
MKCRLAAVLCLVCSSLALADDKPNPNGSWKYTANVNGQEIEVTIKLKLEGDKLTGSVTVADMETKIEDAKYKDGKASFKIDREFNGNKIVIKYQGTFKGDTFKVKRDLERDGQTDTREFEAKRVKE